MSGRVVASPGPNSRMTPATESRNPRVPYPRATIWRNPAYGWDTSALAARMFPAAGEAAVLARSNVLAVLLALSGVLFAASGATAEEDRWTPSLSMQYHRVSSVAISPDGSLVAFTVTVPLMEGEKSEYRTQIHVVPAAGGDAVAYTSGENSATSPSFSPDGRTLGFPPAGFGKTAGLGAAARRGRGFPAHPRGERRAVLPLFNGWPERRLRDERSGNRRGEDPEEGEAGR